MCTMEKANGAINKLAAEGRLGALGGEHTSVLSHMFPCITDWHVYYLSLGVAVHMRWMQARMDASCQVTQYLDHHAYHLSVCRRAVLRGD